MQFFDKKSDDVAQNRRRAGKSANGAKNGGLFGWLARLAARDGGHADFHRKA